VLDRQQLLLLLLLVTTVRSGGWAFLCRIPHSTSANLGVCVPRASLHRPSLQVCCSGWDAGAVLLPIGIACRASSCCCRLKG
jgi:hypothetical protein